MRVQFRDPGVVLLPGANRRVEFVVIGNVVAVQTVRSGLKIGRRISITDTQRVQIGHDLARLGKSEPAVELQPVGRARDARMFDSHARENLRQNL